MRTAKTVREIIQDAQSRGIVTPDMSISALMRYVEEHSEPLHRPEQPWRAPRCRACRRAFYTDLAKGTALILLLVTVCWALVR